MRGACTPQQINFMSLLNRTDIAIDYIFNVFVNLSVGSGR